MRLGLSFVLAGFAAFVAGRPANVALPGLNGVTPHPMMVVQGNELVCGVTEASDGEPSIADR
jgi:hypothetical protein